MQLAVYQTIKLEEDEGICVLELNTPPSNTMSLQFFRDLSDAIELVSLRSETEALIITGHGRHFSSGADLGSLLAAVRSSSKQNSSGALEEIPGFLAENYRSLLKLENLNILVIAAIRGVCLGSALELALFSHFRISGEDAVFGLPEASYNLVPGLGGIYKLSSLAGDAKALDLVLRGNTFRAEDALSYGIIDRLVPRKSLMPMAIEFAKNTKVDYRPEKRPLYIKKYLS
jgi:enoyl-CoA hydratase/carnithine racemase